MTIEDLRFQAVAHFVDFDLEKDQELQEVVELASAVTDSPLAFISFLDDKTQYFKVRKGITETTIPRQKSFCAHAVESGELLMVPDTAEDSRFADNPFVTCEPGIKFFASMPLTIRDGQKIGTLCVLDQKPRALEEHQQVMLRILSNQVVKIMELKADHVLLEKNRLELEEQRKLNSDANIRLRSFFESSTNFQVLLGRCGEVIDFNKTAFNFIKTVHNSKLQRGDQFVKYIHPEFVATFLKQYNLALEDVKSAKEGSTDYGDMGVIWWEAAFETARDENNEIIGVSYLIRNVTERKLKEQKIIAQNQSLLQIAHIQAHEFRAPLTTIMGLMSLIKEEAHNPPSEYITFLEQAVETLDSTIRHIVSNIDEAVVDDYASDLQSS